MEGFMNTIEKVKKIIAEQLCISVDDIKDDANIIEDLGADSLDIVELLMTFEDEFKVSIPDERLEELKSIPQIVAIIDEFSKK
jgi:acyl carrier protein